MTQASTSVDQSIPRHPGSSRRNGFAAQSVSAVTACPTALRNGARSHCIAKRSRNAYVNSPNAVSSRNLSAWSIIATFLYASPPSASPSSCARCAAAFAAAMIEAFT